MRGPTVAVGQGRATANNGSLVKVLLQPLAAACVHCCRNECRFRCPSLWLGGVSGGGWQARRPRIAP